jgi:hypothetical protein
LRAGEILLRRPSPPTCPSLRRLKAVPLPPYGS